MTTIKLYIASLIFAVLILGSQSETDTFEYEIGGIVMTDINGQLLGE